MAAKAAASILAAARADQPGIDYRSEAGALWKASLRSRCAEVGDITMVGLTADFLFDVWATHREKIMRRVAHDMKSILLRNVFLATPSGARSAVVTKEVPVRAWRGVTNSALCCVISTVVFLGQWFTVYRGAVTIIGVGGRPVGGVDGIAALATGAVITGVTAGRGVLLNLQCVRRCFDEGAKGTALLEKKAMDKRKQCCEDVCNAHSNAAQQTDASIVAALYFLIITVEAWDEDPQGLRSVTVHAELLRISDMRNKPAASIEPLWRHGYRGGGQGTASAAPQAKDPNAPERSSATTPKAVLKHLNEHVPTVGGGDACIIDYIKLRLGFTTSRGRIVCRRAVNQLIDSIID